MSILENAVNQAIADFDEMQATAEIPDGVPTRDYAEYQAQNEQNAYEAGKNKEWSDFWDSYQKNNDYTCAFAGRSWNVDNLKPKNKIRPVNANRMFQFNTIYDLEAHFKSLGEDIFSTEDCTNITYMFTNSENTIIPVIDTRKASSLTNTFSYSNIKTIRKLILKDDGSQTFSATFTSASKLENIEIEGTIGQNINLKDCPNLTLDSLWSIAMALENYEMTDNEWKYTITLSQQSQDLLATLGADWTAVFDMKCWNIA